MRKFYNYSKILEIILFGLSVVIINLLLSKNLYWWVLITAIGIIILEIFIKNKEYNPLIKLAAAREAKNKEIEGYGITNHYFMDDYESKNKRNSETAKAIDEANELFLLAETGKSYLDIPTDRHWKNIKERLNSGVHFKVLLIDPYCTNKQVRNILNNTDGVDRKLEIKGLIDLKKNMTI